METLIFSIKFFFKIITVALGTYMSSNDTSIINSKVESIVLESEKIDFSELNPKGETLVLDSLNTSEVTTIKKDVENYKLKGEL